MTFPISPSSPRFYDLDDHWEDSIQFDGFDSEQNSKNDFFFESDPFLSEVPQRTSPQPPKETDPGFIRKSLSEESLTTFFSNLGPPLLSPVFGKWTLEECSPERIQINGCEIRRAYKNNGSVHPSDLRRTSDSYLDCLDRMGIPKNLSMPLFGMTATILRTREFDENNPHSEKTPWMDPIPHLPLLEHYRLYQNQLAKKDLEILLKLLSWMYSYHWTPYCFGRSLKKLESICRFRNSSFKICSNDNPVSAYPLEGIFYLKNRELLEIYDLSYEIHMEAVAGYCINIQKKPTPSDKTIWVFWPEWIIPGHKDGRPMFYCVPYTPNKIHPNDITIEGYFDFVKSIPFKKWRKAEYLKLKELWDQSANIDAEKEQLIKIIYGLAQHAKIFWSKEHHAKNERGEKSSYRKIFLGENLYLLIDKIEKKLNLDYDFLRLAESVPVASSSSSSSRIFENAPLEASIPISPISERRSVGADWILEEYSSEKIRINGCEIKRAYTKDGSIDLEDFHQTDIAYFKCLDHLGIERALFLPIFGTSALIIETERDDFNESKSSCWKYPTPVLPLLQYYQHNKNHLTWRNKQVLLKFLSWMYSYHWIPYFPIMLDKDPQIAKSPHRSFDPIWKRDLHHVFEINSNRQAISKHPFAGKFFLSNGGLLRMYGLYFSASSIERKYGFTISESLPQTMTINIERPEFINPEKPELGKLSYYIKYTPAPLSPEKEYIHFDFLRNDDFKSWLRSVRSKLNHLSSVFLKNPINIDKHDSNAHELSTSIYRLAQHAKLFWNDNDRIYHASKSENFKKQTLRELFLGVSLANKIRKLEQLLKLDYGFLQLPNSLPPDFSSSNSSPRIFEGETIESPIFPQTSEIIVLDKELEEITPSSLQSEASSEEIKAIGNQLQQLNKLISKHYSSFIPDKFRELLIAQKGKWGIDLSHSEISEDDFLKPFYLFLRSHGALKNRKAAIKAVQEAFRFFGFTSASMQIDSETPVNLYCSPDTPCDEDLARQCIKELLTQTDVPAYPHNPLCDFSATEIQQTLLSLKLAEFSIIARNYNHFRRRRQTPPVALPCFLLTQDANHVRIQVLQAYFNDRRLLEGVGEESEDRLASVFLEQHLNEASIIQNSKQGKSTRLTWEQFQQFQQSFHGSSSNSSLPQALVIERLTPVAAIEETPEVLREEITSTRQLAERRESANKRKRPDSSDLLIPKKRRINHEKEEETTNIRGTESRKSLKYEHEFEPINDEEEIISSSKSAKNPSTGELPIISSTSGIYQAPDVPEISLDNFWEALNTRSLIQISAKVSRERIKEAVLNELKPLEYPILGSLQKMTASITFLPFGRLLKQYQINTVNQLLQYGLAGISKLLSLPPGFGKTFVLGEYIVQLIASEPSPQIHVVAGPDALINQNKKELSRYAAEASVTAWQLTGKKGASKGQYIKLFERLIDFSQCSLDELSRFLRIIPYFSNAASETSNGYRALMNNQRVVSMALELFRKHIEYTTQLNRNDPKSLGWFKNQMESLCDHFGISFNSLENLADIIEAKLRVTEDLALRFKLYCLVGHALDLDQDRPQLKEYQNFYNAQSLERVRNLGIAENNSWIVRCKSSKDFDNLRLDPNRPLESPFILITTPEGLDQQTNYLKRFPIGSLVVDEASRVHTSKSAVSEYVKKAIQELKLHSSHEKPKNSVLFVTGTPFENNLAELWNLLTMSSGEFLFSKQTFDALQMLLRSCMQYLTNPENLNIESSEAADPSILVKSFAHFMHFRNVVTQLIHHLAQNDPQARKDWKGRFPIVEYQDIPYRLSKDLIQEINQTKGSKLFSDNKRIERILVHSSLKDTTMERERSQNWPFLEPLRNGNLEQKTQWIGQSVYLTAILANTFFINAMQNKEKVVIVANHVGLCEAYDETIKILFSKNHVFTRIFDGRLDDKEKAKVIEEYKNAPRDNPAVLLLMLKSGGVGLNLAEADRLFLTGTSWNPATDFQAICRIARANTVGTKYIHRLSFPETYYSTHSQLIQDIKKKWEAFLWKETASLKDLLDLWCDVLQAETYRSYLNQEQDLIDAENKNKSVREFLGSWAQSISLQELTSLFDRAKPTVPLITPFPEARIESSSSSRGALRLPQMLVQRPQSNTAPEGSSAPTLSRSVSASASQLNAPAPKLPLPLPLPTLSRPVSVSTSQLNAPTPKLPLPLPLPTLSRPVSSSTQQLSSSSTSATVKKLPLPLPLPTKPQQPPAPRF